MPLKEYLTPVWNIPWNNEYNDGNPNKGTEDTGPYFFAERTSKREKPGVRSIAKPREAHWAFYHDRDSRGHKYWTEVHNLHIKIKFIIIGYN